MRKNTAEAEPPPHDPERDTEKTFREFLLRSVDDLWADLTKGVFSLSLTFLIFELPADLHPYFRPDRLVRTAESALQSRDQAQTEVSGCDVHHQALFLFSDNARVPGANRLISCTFCNLIRGA